MDNYFGAYAVPPLNVVYHSGLFIFCGLTILLSSVAACVISKFFHPRNLYNIVSVVAKHKVFPYIVFVLMVFRFVSGSCRQLQFFVVAVVLSCVPLLIICCGARTISHL